VNMRRATSSDLELLVSLVERLDNDLPRLPYLDHPAEVERAKVEKMIEAGVALIADDDVGAPVGYLLARYGERGPATIYISDLWVEPQARGRGVGIGLLRMAAADAAARGCTHVVLEVHSRNREALAFYQRLGFEEEAKIMRVDVGGLAEPAEPQSPDIGAVHVQTDDSDAVARVVRQYLPRIDRNASAAVDRGTAWTVVRVEADDRAVVRRLARELSFRFGVSLVLTLEEGAVVHYVLHDQGRMVDEYLSVPEYYGPLPPGDALALRANPTVVARLTGADPDLIRRVARTAASPRELPEPRELFEEIAAALRVTP